METPFVIFDRDGTLIEHVHHLKNAKDVKFKPDLISALMKLQKIGFLFGMVTNQSVIGRGIATPSQVNEINSKIAEFLLNNGVPLQFSYTCPHLPDDSCSCRKPKIDLGLRAIHEYGVSPDSSFVIGDQESDIIFGNNLGCRTIQIKGKAERSLLSNYYAETLDLAADWIKNEAYL